jgi:hypothetical protein
MRRIAFALLALGSAGCAGSKSAPDLGPSSPASTSAMMNPTSGIGASVANQNTSAASKAVIAVPIDKAWQALAKAYALIPIPTTEVDAASHRLGNSAFKVRRKLGNIQLRNALDCGGDDSNPNADSYEITLSVRSQMSVDPSGGTMLQSFVEGVGKNQLTNSSNQVPCYSSGAIETRILDLVKSGTGLSMPVVKKPG